MSKFFSPPMSVPKPASVTTKPSGPTRSSATRSATTLELPWAMLAKGPQWTRTGVPSRVCIRVGMRASFKSTVSAPVTPRSSQVTSAPEADLATSIAPSRARRSAASVASARTAMISEATAMSKPVSRVCPFSVGLRPISTLRRKRSHVSRTRFHATVSTSTSRRTRALRSAASSSAASVTGLVTPMRLSRAASGAARGRAPSLRAGQSRLKRASSFCVRSWKTRASSAAATRLFAATTAWMSPVRCEFISSMGITCE
mmetsp:Transcript_13691/g.43246  ORF Transcript_13691/g.43246 Transcript_13691/m.43246 type:complete len:258 (+) Transcript_13691:1096-1869(+)